MAMIYPSRNETILELAKFFLEEFASDAAGVGDWVAQGGIDIDHLVEQVKRIKAELE